MLNVDSLVAQRLPDICTKPLVGKSVRGVLRYLLHERALQDIEKEFPHLKGVDFVEMMLDYFDFGYCISDKDREKIPATGRVVIVANHPIGTLDGLAMIKMIAQIRPDFKIVVNDLLSHIKPLQPLLIPVNNMGGKAAKDNIERMHQQLQDEGAVIIFPAGEVSRMGASGIRDAKWKKGFLKLASSAQAPILPVYMDARNSAFFYTMSALYKPMSTLFLVAEMFKQAHKRMNIKVGDIIPFQSYDGVDISNANKVQLFKKHLYNIGKDKSPIFKTEKAIAHPENRAHLKAAIKECEYLGRTADNKVIVLYQYSESSTIMREIGRLREVAFRLVGEGTGQHRDIDSFDRDYLHLILWDEDDLEVIGAYRFAKAQSVVDRKGFDGLYTHTLFDYQPAMETVIEHGLELGRSFVQPRYWGKRSLEYLWVGIGAYLAKNPQYRYLFGPVSVSNSYPKAAKSMMVNHYSHYFPARQRLAKARIPFIYDEGEQENLLMDFCAYDQAEDFSSLKHTMANMGVGVPTLYKQYASVCEKEGVSFSAFNIDPDFSDCIDALVTVDITKLLPKKRARYIDIHHGSE